VSTFPSDIRAQLAESCRVKQDFSDELVDKIAQFAQTSAASLNAGGKIIFFGNGGSAADAQHLAAELVVRLQSNRRALAALALTTNSSVLTAAANDYGYEQVFARQIEAFAAEGDVVVALSTSGQSANVLAGARAAIAQKAHCVGFTGQSGGVLASIASLLLNVPSEDAQRIQEAHITIGHIACGLIERILFNS
jgi:D-sedoheptulose 7-phosphate isomerase